MTESFAMFGEGGIFGDLADFEFVKMEDSHRQMADFKLMGMESLQPHVPSDDALNVDFDIVSAFDLTADISLKTLDVSGADSGYSSPTDSPSHQWWGIDHIDTHEEASGRSRLLSLSGLFEPMDIAAHDEAHDLLSITGDLTITADIFQLGAQVKQQTSDESSEEVFPAVVLGDSSLNRSIDPTVLTQFEEEEIEIDVVGDGDSQYSSPALLSRADSIASISTVASASTVASHNPFTSPTSMLLDGATRIWLIGALPASCGLFAILLIVSRISR